EGPRPVATSVAVFRVRRARETQHSPNAYVRCIFGSPAPRLVLRPDTSRCDSEDRENAALSRERATGVEPATSSLGSFRRHVESRLGRVSRRRAHPVPARTLAPGFDVLDTGE